MATVTVTAPKVRAKVEKRAVECGLPEYVVKRAVRRRKKAFRAVAARVIISVLLIVFVIGYIGAYAQLRLYGYRKCEYVKEQRQLIAENLSIRAEIDKLSEPDRISSIAEQDGFVAGSEIYRLGQVSSVKLAKAE